MEEVSVTYVTPEMYGYTDRGIQKWMGLILADQTDAIKQINNEVDEIEGKDEMSIEEISQVLHRAYAMDFPIAIQANAMRNGSYYKDVECKIAGYGNGRIFLKVIDGRKTSCTIDQIRNVEYMSPLDWYDKKK
ncbi:hypothetical protein [Oceanobacillus neutriphilus]|uniref:Uncharacterized protein n=1 Tax=Oceanobacillus neutriphilus TaxID=531815 RepID=A0ABQ2P270_9BACI|nr:hypothetical protein [Oceanobacillus neutriphilus]GGP16199.1 hypothetical protein GCM10011346_47220 [Oceanobacillus neutriphilus]